MDYNKTSAYDLSLFDTAAKELEKAKAIKKKKKNPPKVVKIPQEAIHKIRLRKHSPLKVIGGALGVIAIASVVITIIMGQVQLTELNQKIISAQNVLSDQQSVYTQTQMAVQSKLSTSGIQEYAENRLGMTKATNAQKEFVELSKGDKAEITQETDNDFLSQISNAISNLWS
ncbi:MAG: hypothetical protein J1E56_04295 [Ruminococcus sp.]|nr:hypothetical protein [Ruminococcus sp.]